MNSFVIFARYMKKRFKNWSEFYQRINLVFNGIIAFSLLPFAWVFLELERGGGGLSIITGWSRYVFQASVLIMIGLGLNWAHRSGKKAIEAIPVKMTLRDKLWEYYQVQVRKLILFEATAVLALIATYINSDYLFVFAYVFILFLFSMNRPRYDKVVDELKLSKKERKLLESGVDLE